MKNKKISIRVRYTVIFVLILGAAIALSVLLNNIGLEDYYRVTKINTMLTAYERIGELRTSLDDIEDKNDRYDFFVPGFDLGDFLYNDNKEEEKDNPLITYLNNIQSESNITTLILYGNKTYTVGGIDAKWMLKLLSELQMQRTMKNTEIIKKTDYYSLVKTYDTEMDTNYLACYGKYDDKTYFLMRTPMLSIAESAAISNRFYIYVGTGALLLGVIVVFFVMGFITKPIISLTDISNKMSHLDFDAKYEGNSGDEIGELGEHMNELSEKLQSTIAQLKNANLELQNDIEAKNNLAKEKSEFVANVSHELKTPIALIQGYAEGLMDGIADDPENMAFYCEVIKDEADKMNQMVKRILSLNQLEFGDDKMDMSRFDITQLIKGVADASAILAKQKNAVIVFNHKDPVYIWADEYRIEEVITNFISNAIHYVSGKNIIEIRLSESDGKCRLEVYNSGSHIPDEDIDKIWDKFYKVDKARTREYGGNGIGLSIVKAIVDRHNGTCKAENTEDGVVFWMEIPA